MTATVEDQGVDALFTRVEAALANTERALTLFAGIISASTEARFRNGGDPPGSWPEIQAASRRKRKGDKSAPPLTDLGDLRRAATAIRPGVPFSLFAILPDGLVMGTDKPGARALQDGYVGGGKHGPGHGTPARPFMMITEADKMAMVGVYSTVLDGVIAGTTL